MQLKFQTTTIYFHNQNNNECFHKKAFDIKTKITNTNRTYYINQDVRLYPRIQTCKGQVMCTFLATH